MATRQILKDISVCFFISLLIFFLCFPEFFIPPLRPFFEGSQEYMGAFLLTNWLHHGGIQLWDRYDQMSFVYLILTNGMFKILQVLTAAVYLCISPFVWDQAKTFTLTFSVVFVVTNLLLKTIGSYLLLKRFTSNRILLYLSTIFLSVFFANNCIGEALVYQSFIPLFIHLGLTFFEKPSLYNLGVFLTYMVVSLASSIVQGLYIYCGAHFLFLYYLVSKILESSKNLKQYFTGIYVEWKIFYRRYILMILIWILILGPYVYMTKFCLNDFYFDAEHSRVNNLWSISSYLAKVVDGAPSIICFMWDAVNYSIGQVFPFCGWTIVFLCISGLILSIDKRKYTFLFGFLFLLFLSNVHVGPLSQSINQNIFVWAAHWLAILTNPFKFVLRNYLDYANKFFPFLLMPLAVMGADAIIKHEKISLPLWRMVLLGGVISFFAAVCFFHLSGFKRIYLIVSMVLIIGFIISLIIKNKSIHKIGWEFLIALLILDTSVFIYHIRSNYGIDTPQSIVGKRELGHLELNYNNPFILPLLDYYDCYYYDQYKNQYFLLGALNMPGVIFHYTNTIRDLIYFDEYIFPHYKILNYLNEDRKIYVVSLRNFVIATPDRYIYDVHYAVKASDSTYAEMIKYHHEERALVMIHDTDSPTINDKLPTSVQNRKPYNYKTNIYQGYFNKVKNYKSNGLTLYTFPYPAECPQYRASTFLTLDSIFLRLSSIDKNTGSFQELKPIQGGIVSDMTFDVNNIRKGWVTAGFSKEQTNKAYSFVCYENLNGITNVWKNEWDNLGVDYVSGNNGWLVLLYPYDKKWKITVDGKPTQFYRANYSFMSIPITEGAHKILIQYWPDTWLRQFLFISMVLSTVCLFWVLYMCILK